MIKHGWIKDVIDPLDRTRADYRILSVSTVPPKAYDLSKYFGAIEDQKDLGSCTAEAVVGMVEYYESRKLRQYIPFSRLYTYKVTRKLEGSESGDVGATIRGAMSSVRTLGVCPEVFYTGFLFDDEPTAFSYAVASNYKLVDYYRLDLDGDLKDKIRLHISQGIPIAFGLELYENFPYKSSTGLIKMPKGSLEGGHALTIVGYDSKYIKFRNSWGEQWGDNGYGYMPWEYIQYCSDFWVITSMKYAKLEF